MGKMIKKRTSNLIVALIPARSGSKRIRNKNLQKIGPSTLIEISISHAKNCKKISKVFVSSDSNSILSIAQDVGASTVLRPKNISTDKSTANQVVEHFISFAFKNVPEFSVDSTIIYMQPTSPFRSQNLVDKCLKIFLQDFKPLVVVSKVIQHPNKMLYRSKQNTLLPYASNSSPTSNYQDLPEIFIPTGSIYIFLVSDFQKFGLIPITTSTPYVVDGIDSLDIDSSIELDLARNYRGVL
jgi:CMP-N,N'-diacetyllegionaminic acid synthase